MSEFVAVDDLRVEVRRSGRRKTVDLTVDRAGGLVIAVPESLEQPEIERIIRQKQLWIYTTLDRKEEAMHPAVKKKYVTGEGFYYPGKKYRLKVLDAVDGETDVPDLRLKNGRFLLREVTANGRDHFIEWYSAQGRKMDR